MGDTRHVVEKNGDASDADALLDRMVEESLAQTRRTKSATVAYAAPATADEFLNDAVTFLRHRPDRDELLARLAEMSRPPAAVQPSAADTPTPPAAGQTTD